MSTHLLVLGHQALEEAPRVEPDEDRADLVVALCALPVGHQLASRLGGVVVEVVVKGCEMWW
jgi:hypothetical protein